jgi:hypothetical protein
VAHLRLDPDAADVARVGSRFWIVRPQFGLARVTGLETVVGARYLEVLPGAGDAQRQFVGLSEPPVADALEKGGLDVVLEGTHRGSLQAGSPVTYRKIRVGTVLSVGLASDARTVEVHARIRPAYKQLVREGTRFWDASGVALDLGITGVTLHLDTLEAMLMGGVSLATPPGAGPVVSTGHRFALHDEADSDWLEWEPALVVGHSLLPAGLPLPRPMKTVLRWTEGSIWSSDEEREGWVLAVDGGVLGPGDLFAAPPAAHEGSVTLELGGESLPLDAQTTAGERGPLMALFAMDPPLPPWPRQRQRRPDAPEDCLVLTGPGGETRGLATSRFQADGDTWRIDRAIPFDGTWHGACVVARSDGALLGLLVIDRDEARVALLP